MDEIVRIKVKVKIVAVNCFVVRYYSDLIQSFTLCFHHVATSINKPFQRGNSDSGSSYFGSQSFYSSLVGKSILAESSN